MARQETVSTSSSGGKRRATSRGEVVEMDAEVLIEGVVRRLDVGERMEVTDGSMD